MKNIACHNVWKLEVMISNGIFCETKFGIFAQRVTFCKFLLETLISFLDESIYWLILSTVIGLYLDSFKYGIQFSPFDLAEISLRYMLNRVHVSWLGS